MTDAKDRETTVPYLDREALERQLIPVARELCGGGAARLTTLPGGASVRRFHRLEIARGSPPSLVVMELGASPLASEEVSKARATELPFINVHRYLERAGMAVPRIYRYDEAAGLVYVEDLGDVTLEARVTGASEATQRRIYRLAIDDLVRLQRFAAAHPDSSCTAFSRRFDFDLLKWELDHFVEYGIPQPLDAARASELDRQFRAIAKQLAAAPSGFVHRDYQSRNLMVQEGSSGIRLRVIDFQDALLGPAAYDLVGLLRDSYVPLSDSLLDELVGYYCEQAGIAPAGFVGLFDLQTVQRKLKDAGRFVFIDRVKKNPTFLEHIPRSLVYVRRALSRLPEWATVSNLLNECLP